MNNTKSKILVLTVNGWNNTTGTSTISSILEGYPKECIANIFLRADKPNSNICDKYYRIDELKVLKSIINRNTKTGYIVTPEADVDFAEERNVQLQLKEKKNNLTPFIRDFVWKIGVWKTKELKEFVLGFNPDIIFFPAEALIHFNNIGLYISKLLKKPIGLFFWDDNFTYKPVNGILPKLYRFFQNRNIKKIAKKSSFSFAINKKMQAECFSELGIKPVLLTKPMANTEVSKPYCYSGKTIKILYTGSIYIGRGETILELVNAIKKVNAAGSNFFLEIYTNSVLSDEEKKQYNVGGVSAVLPPVTKEEVLKLQQGADILLFAEALEGEYKYAARLSFSTKIIDYLSARRCILAIGPSDIAPIEYFKSNDIAFVANDSDSIQNALLRISDSPDCMSYYAEKAYEYGLNNHSKSYIFSKFEETILCISKKGE